MVYIKQNKGITLTALIVMIIVIMILTGITITQGSTLIETSKVENYVTNMITIRAKAKVYAEEINGETWDVEDKQSKRKELYLEKYEMNSQDDNSDFMSKIDEKVNTGNGCEFYIVGKNALMKMGLEELAKESNEGDYVVAYDSSNYKNLDVIYTPGVEYKKVTYYTLSSLQEKVEE